MTPEQEQHAIALVKAWGKTAYGMHADAMAALLEELINAPEPEPVARVTGYYGGYLSIATVDGRVLPAGTALYAAPPAPSVSDGWRSAIAKEFPLYDEDGLDEDKHCCEWVMLQERKRLHKILTAPTPAEAPADVARDAERYRACNGSNCGCTDGISHSDECISEHDSIVNSAAQSDHVEHGGWKCYFCGYDGQDNQRYNQFCARCKRHR